MRKIISYFINYPKAVNIIILFFIFFGIAGIISLKSSFFPLIDSNFVSINITYLGASPNEIEEGIILKIEDNLKGIAGIDRISSTARENNGSILVEISQNKNIDLMLLEVKNAIDRVPSYPANMEPIVVSKVDEQRPTIIFSLAGEKTPLTILKSIGRTIEKDLRDIEGISQVNVSGYPEEEIEIAINENILLAYNLTFEEIKNSIRNTNILVTGGKVKTENEEFLIRAKNRNYYADELSNIIIRSDNKGKIVRLSDIATIRDKFSETPLSSSVDGNKAIIITVSSTNDEDLTKSAQQIRNYIDEFNAKNQNLKLTSLQDRSKVLRQRTNLLLENGTIGIFLVLILLSIFLNIRLAFWVAFGLPISFLGMLIFAGQAGVTINLMSLFGMIVVVGILVDDGIVIAENIYQNFEKGKSPAQAAIDGTIEVLPAILCAILTTIIAFGTLLFLDGQVSEFFGEVAIIVILTLMVSLIEALIILPSHLAHSKALVAKRKVNENFISRVFKSMRKINKKGNDLMFWLRDKLYSPILIFALRNRFLSFAGFIAALLLTIGSIGGGIIGVTFFPTIASDIVTVDLNMPEGTHVKITDSIISIIEDNVWIVGAELSEEFMKNDKRKLIRNVRKNIGIPAQGIQPLGVPSFDALGNSSIASLEIYLLDSENRSNKIKASLFANLLREKMGEVVGVEKLVYGSGVNFGGYPISVSLLSTDVYELKLAKQELLKILNSNSLLTDIANNDPEGIKEIHLKLNENANLLGLSLSSVMAQVRSGFFGVEAQRFQRGEDEIRVWVRYDETSRSMINNLEQMRILTPYNKRVPLMEIADYEIKRGDVSINHLDGKREIQISANLKNENQSASDIVYDLKNNVLPKIQLKYPSISASFEGQNREANKIIDSATKILPLTLFLIFIVIGFTFRSYSQPFLLLMLIPFSLTTVAWGHLIHGFPVNIISMLGIIALIGILVNDGLILISKFNQNLRDGLNFDDSLYKAGRSRFRAIFLTSITTIAGLAPIILEKSFQAQLLKPMAISIAYGIGYATFLTLIMLPIFISGANSFKIAYIWLTTGKKLEKKEVESPIIELKNLIKK